MVDIRVQVGRLVDEAADAIVVNLFQGAQQPAGATADADAGLGGAISRLIALGDFSGKLNELAVFYPEARSDEGREPRAFSIRSPRVLLVGLGKQEELTLDRVRQVAATAARRARSLGARTLATKLHGVGAGVLSARDAAQAVVEGTLLGLYRFDQLKGRARRGGAEGEAVGDNGNRSRPVDGASQGNTGNGSEDENGDAELGRAITRLTLVEPDAAWGAEAEVGARRGRILAESAILARDLVTQPGNILSPRALAEAARRVAQDTGLRCDVLEPAQLAELGMGAFLGVAQGSEEPAQFIILEHAPAGRAEEPPIILCGKAITFDSGGISIKPAEGMGAMKDDMSGGAAVLGALRALALLGVPRRTIGLIGAAENMPSGRAIRPGDVLRAMDGQTIEVISTDAEGRLVLADVLAYGHRFKPAVMVDIATLTGGIVTALGHAVAGVMGNNADVIRRLTAAGNATGEKVWELPLWDEEYKRSIRSEIADMKNSVGRAASAIGGAMLLKQFARKVPWCHIDIAGVAWANSDAPYRPKGATGYGVRLLSAFVEADAQEGGIDGRP